ncbi:NADH-quinone oxidoreductase subunit NuoG [Xanthomonadaceae bacterium JHOS43]|nr:NADH-quinone oxidoreductase subunit NuoG [Xanthomonadaceae bacterium JHOS43]
MSAQPAPTAPPPAPEGHVNVEIDGVAMIAPKGSMIIQAADKAGIPIPRFCYHEKLPIAANCRMCLVDVEKSPKPAPACATPVMEGMKVYTQTRRALDSQRNVMEFLLINHPLDCPVCDQGGECELQDVAMGYGRSVSRYVERKRVVPDENLGPLVASDMTRCIQCTRCVRFTSEIAGTYELGGMGRGDRLEIGTYIGKAIESELSGNVIDVCPVGALTNKPFRFRARPWELIARESIGYHDALGSNLWLHLRRGEVLRSVPRDNEGINENWLSDRDRYSHAGLAASDRLTAPMIRRGDAWQEATWEEAIARAAELISAQSGDDVGVLVHPSTSNEEGALLAALAQGIGSGNLDHRIAQSDLADAPVANTFQMPLATIESADAIVLIGCNPRHEAPLLSHRIRKAQRAGAKVIAVNPIDFDFNFALTHNHVVAPAALVDAVSNLAVAAGASLPAEAFAQPVDSNAAAAVASVLKDAQRGVIVLGEVAATHAQASWLRAAARALAQATGAAVNEISLGANAIGLTRHGVLPKARDVNAMLAQPRKAYVLFGIEPAQDFSDQPTALRALSQASAVVAFTAFADETTRRVAQVMLPIGLAPEIDGTYVNVDGVTQQVGAAAKLPGQARPGWRVLRALGAQMNLSGFDFTELSQCRAALAPQDAVSGSGLSERATARDGALQSVTTRAIYRIDAVTRRSAPLAAHPLTAGARVALNPEDALARSLSDGAIAKVDDGRGTAALPVAVSTRVPRGAVWIERGYDATAAVAGTGAWLTVTRA